MRAWSLPSPDPVGAHRARPPVNRGRVNTAVRSAGHESGWSVVDRARRGSHRGVRWRRECEFVPDGSLVDADSVIAAAASAGVMCAGEPASGEHSRHNGDTSVERCHWSDRILDSRRIGPEQLGPAVDQHQQHELHVDGEPWPAICAGAGEVRRVVGKLVERSGVHCHRLGQLAEVLTGPANLLEDVNQHRRRDVLRIGRIRQRGQAPREFDRSRKLGAGAAAQRYTSLKRWRNPSAVKAANASAPLRSSIDHRVRA